jgi:hypothetical protein
MNFLAMQGLPPALPIRTLHQHTQSVGATGGVYKGQGRNQRAFVLTGKAVVGLPLSASQHQVFGCQPHLGSQQSCHAFASSQRLPLGRDRLYLKHNCMCPPPFSL